MADLVESVRIMQSHEDDLIARWIRFVSEVRIQLLPELGGRMVKSHGDGFLLEFTNTPHAVAAALEIHRRLSFYSAGRSSAEVLFLRVGVHVADVVVEDLDIYGSGVNLAARLATLAGPGEIVVSEQVRDELTDGLDSFVVDLGECFLKHYAQSVRAYRVVAPHAVGQRAMPFDTFADDRPLLAVVPLLELDGQDGHMALGDAIADDVIAAMSQSSNLRVISRLSSSAFRNHTGNLQEIRRHLGVAYVVTGTYRVRGSHVTVRAELCDARDGRMLWSDAATVLVADIFNAQDKIIPSIAANVGRQVVRSELQRARSLPVATLDGYTLYLASVVMLHHLAPADFEQARSLLDHLSQRFPRSAAPHAMLAKWHVLRMVQGWAEDPTRQGREAQYCAQRALELEPDNALALAMDAILLAHLDGELERARDRCVKATESNPQEPHAWLNLSGIHSYLGDTQPAEALSMRAVQLSPMDPARFLFEAFVAAGKLTAGKFQEAADAARSSIRLNALHPPSHRLLTIALSLDGKIAEAQRAGADLMRVHPSFRVSAHKARYAGRDRPHAQSWFQALSAAGVPM